MVSARYRTPPTFISTTNQTEPQGRNGALQFASLARVKTDACKYFIVIWTDDAIHFQPIHIISIVAGDFLSDVIWQVVLPESTRISISNFDINHFQIQKGSYPFSLSKNQKRKKAMSRMINSTPFQQTKFTNTARSFWLIPLFIFNRRLSTSPHLAFFFPFRD